MKNIFKLFLVLILLVAIGWGIWFFSNKSAAQQPPTEFLMARQKGSEISQSIVEIASSTNRQIKEINSLDLVGDSAKALNLIEETKNNNKENLNQAVKLADEMQKMASSLDKISSPKSREIAIKAITSEENLITNLINYNQTLDLFLNNLYKAIATSRSEYRQAAENNLADLNLRTITINNLNQEFLDYMREFDESFSR